MSAQPPISSRGERAGLRTGPAGRWTYSHRIVLRVTAVAIAALVFVFWSQPTWQIALVIAVVLLEVAGRRTSKTISPSVAAADCQGERYLVPRG